MSKLKSPKNIDPIDREALQRAISLTLTEDDPGRVEQVQEKLTGAYGDSWLDVACFCSFHRQSEVLGSDITPSGIDPDLIDEILAVGPDPIRRIIIANADQAGAAITAYASSAYYAARLAKRLLVANLSLWEPDPIAALKKIGLQQRHKPRPRRR